MTKPERSGDLPKTRRRKRCQGRIVRATMRTTMIIIHPRVVSNISQFNFLPSSGVRQGAKSGSWCLLTQAGQQWSGQDRFGEELLMVIKDQCARQHKFHRLIAKMLLPEQGGRRPADKRGEGTYGTQFYINNLKILSCGR